MTEEKKKSPEQITGATYIQNYAQQINLLTHYWSIYEMALAKIQKDNQISEEKKQELSTLVDSIKYYSQTLYILHTSIYKHLGKEITQEFTEQYVKIKTDIIPDRTILEKFIVTLHFSLMDNVLKTLLQNSESIINSL